MASWANTSIAHYSILSELGVGGMGEVYLAVDKRLDRRVAIKVLEKGISDDPDRLARFIQEARSASSLNHPNIITIYDIGEHEGVSYIASEYIDGLTLRERMAQGGLHFDELLTIAVQAAEALAAAHAAGIVHRDIKPENVMIRRDGYVKVLDFGLAKLTEADLHAPGTSTSHTLLRTGPGVVLGTAAYMSPEQARGTDVDARSDVFSFGILLYEMVAGRRPFSGETAADLIVALLQKEPESLRKVVPQVPRGLATLVTRCLQKKREDRPSNMAEVLDALREVRDQVGSGSRRITSSSAGETVTAKFAPAILTQSESGKDSILLTEFTNETGDTVFDRTLRTALAFSLEQSPFLNILPETKVRQTLRLMGRSADERVDAELGREICERQGLKAYITSAIAMMGSLYVITLEAVNARTGESLGRRLEEAASKEDVLKALGHAATGLRETLGETLSSLEKFSAPLEYTTSSLEALRIYSLGREIAIRGDSLGAIPFFRKAVELDPNFAFGYNQLAVAYRNSNQWDLAAENSRKAFELRDTVSENEKQRITYSYYSYVTGEIGKQIETLNLWIHTYPNSHIPLVNLADCYQRIGEHEKAIETARRCLQLDSSATNGYWNLAEAQLSLGRFDEVKATCVGAQTRGLDSVGLRSFRFIVAAVEGDEPSMDEQLEWFNGRADQYFAFELRAAKAAFEGRAAESEALSRRASALAEHAGALEVAAQFAADRALRSAIFASPTPFVSGASELAADTVVSHAEAALALARNRVTLATAALALAAVGKSERAESLADELRSQHSKNTLVIELWLPVVRAAVHLYKGEAAAAIEALEPTERYETAAAFIPQTIRSQAFARAGDNTRAAAEFDRIIRARGGGPLSSLYPLAYLGKARNAKDKAGYEKFFEYWKDADKDIPALIAGRAEFDSLD